MPSLPLAYNKWMEQLLEGPLPEERRADCSACVMLSSSSEHPEGITSYHPDCRCCTYVPRVHNYLAGRILRDDRAEGYICRQLVAVRIARHIALSPLGLIVPPQHVHAYDKLQKMGRFGRDPSMKCPFLLNHGKCGIWLNRNAACATWFCRYNNGARSQAFWIELRALLTLTEHVLAFHAARTLCFPHAKTSRSDLDSRLAGLEWGDIHPDGIADYYMQCADLIDQYENFDQVRDLADGLLEDHITATKAAYQAMLRDPLEDGKQQLVPARYKQLGVDQNKIWLMGYSKTDPIKLRGPLFDQLAQFDGRPLDEVRQTLDLDDDTVRALIDFHILKTPDKANETPNCEQKETSQSPASDVTTPETNDHTPAKSNSSENKPA